jgi:hypothetical protein
VSLLVTAYNLAGLPVGFSDSISWLGLVTPMQQLGFDPRPDDSQTAHIRFYNESGAALIVSSNAGRDEVIPAGAWPTWDLENNETSMRFTINALGGQALFNTLYVVLYQPGEAVVATPALGNSPIGGSVATSSTPANAFEQDLFSPPFVYTGLIPTPVGITSPKQMNVSAGVAFLRQADSSLGRVAPAMSTWYTAVASTTYFLDLNPDGSWSWSTSHSSFANYLTIAIVTTDGSGNISGITDAAASTISMLSAFTGIIQSNFTWLRTGSSLPYGYGWNPTINLNYPAIILLMFPVDAGTPQWNLQFNLDHSLSFFDVTDNVTPLKMSAVSGDVALGHNLLVANDVSSLAGSTLAGVGVPGVLSPIAEDVAVSVTTSVTLLTITPAATGTFRANFCAELTNTGNATISAILHYRLPDGTAKAVAFNAALGALNALVVATPTKTNIQAFSMIFRAEAGVTITVTFQDSTNSPTDLVTAFIERIS